MKAFLFLVAVFCIFPAWGDESFCNLFEKSSLRNHPSGLTQFWAQEYTGADLVRQQLMEDKREIDFSKTIQIWDTKLFKHAQVLTHLIQSPYSTGLNPGPSLGHTEIYHSKDYFSAYVDAFMPCEKKGQCPRFINNSMGWHKSFELAQVVEKIAAKNIIVVVSAGNDGKRDDFMMEAPKELLSKNKTIISVGSIDPVGSPSESSNISPYLTISAPADDYIVSYEGDEQVHFNGTSATAPQVTAALALFEELSGLKITLEMAHDLLKETALPLPGPLSLGPHNMGHGMLNTYLISELGNSISAACKTSAFKKRCLQDQWINRSSLVKNKNINELIKRAQGLYPNCFEFKTSRSLSSLKCEERKELLFDLRKAGFIDHHNKNIWKIISCIYKTEGFSKNAQFYERLSQKWEETTDHVKLANNDINFYSKYILSHPHHKNVSLVQKLLKDKKNILPLIKYVLSRPEWGEEDVLQDIIQDGEFDQYLLQFVFSQEAYLPQKKTLKKILAREKNDIWSARFIYSRPHWQELKDELIELISRKKALREVALYVLSHEHWNDKTLVEKLLLDGSVDGLVAQFILSKAYWKNHPELVVKLIVKGKIDSVLHTRTLNLPHWKEHAELFAIEAINRTPHQPWRVLRPYVERIPDYANNQRIMKALEAAGIPSDVTK